MRRTQRILTIISVLIAVSALPTKADYREDSRAVNIFGGEDHTLVLTADKNAWTCGPNGDNHIGVGIYSGVLGTGSRNAWFDQKTVVKVHGPNDVNSLENIDDMDAGWKHSLALDVNGFVWSWGWNSEGQLGVGEGTPDSNVPVPVLRNGLRICCWVSRV